MAPKASAAPAATHLYGLQLVHQALALAPVCFSSRLRLGVRPAQLVQQVASCSQRLGGGSAGARVTAGGGRCRPWWAGGDTGGLHWRFGAVCKWGRLWRRCG